VNKQKLKSMQTLGKKTARKTTKTNLNKHDKQKYVHIYNKKQKHTYICKKTVNGGECDVRKTKQTNNK